MRLSKRETMTVRLPAAVRRALEACAKQRGMTGKSLVEKWLIDDARGRERQHAAA